MTRLDRPRGPVGRRRARAVLPLLLLFAQFAAPDVHAFSVDRHANMTAQVLLEAGAPAGAVSVIVHGAVAPDLVDCVASGYCPVDLPDFLSPDPEQVLNDLSPHHFDNNQVALGVDWVVDRVQGASAAIANNPLSSFGDYIDYAGALFRFGQGLHALQDFYSHANYAECQKSYLQLFGDPENLDLFDGVADWICNTPIGPVTISGLQTGYYGLPVPAGSLHHDDLNKDSPGSPEGARQVFTVFPSTLVGSWYQIVSGEFDGSGFGQRGLAPRHTLRAYQVLTVGGNVFSQVPARAVPKRADVIAQMAIAESSPDFQAIVAEIEALRAQFDGENTSTYPADQFDENGIPLSLLATAAPSPSGLAPRLSAAHPNPFNPRVQFEVAVPERLDGRRALVEIFDARGRRVARLHDGPLDGGEHGMVWEGRDAAGRPMPSGVYRVRLQMAGVRRVQSVTLVR